MATNPFKPTAGKMPPILLGREDIIGDFKEGIENGAGAPGRLMLVYGQRGYGKTVLLTELGRVAESYGWEVVSETASPGVCERIVAAMNKSAGSGARVEFAPEISLGGLAKAKLGAVTLELDQAALTLREAIEKRLEKVKRGKGILFTIDEAQAGSRAEMIAIATAIQHIIRDEDMNDVPDEQKKGIAFVFAALPSIVDDLINDNVLTFLRRCLQRELSPINMPDVKNAFIETIEKSGKSISQEDALHAARLTEGYPYMIQLIGYYMWQSAQNRGAARIDENDVKAGVFDAQLAFQDAVCAPAYKGLTDTQQQFLKAMVSDFPNPSSISDIAQRVGKTSSWASKYRSSLIDAQVIEPSGRGYVKLSIPHFDTYLKSVE